MILTNERTTHRLPGPPLILGSLSVILGDTDLPGPGEAGGGPVHQVVRVLLRQHLVDDHHEGLLVGDLYLKEWST